MSNAAITINGLSKTYRPRRRGERELHALKPLDLVVNKGEVFGLLGPNGAGKTTLVKLLLGVVFPSSGTASLLGHDIPSTKSRIGVGYLPENHRYPNYLTGDGVMAYFGRLNGLTREELKSRAEQLLDLVDMRQWRTNRVRTYSKGMLQRIGLAQSLLNDPQIVFLDEPTDGVDPIGRKEIRDVIVRLRDSGKTVFLNSHLLSEVELVSDRVAILNRGSMLRLGSVTDLTRMQGSVSVEVDAPLSSVQHEVFERAGAVEIREFGGTVSLSVQDLNALIDALRSNGAEIRSVIPQRATLEEIFIDAVTNNAEVA